MSPAEYLRRWPSGAKSAAAREVLAARIGYVRERMGDYPIAVLDALEECCMMFGRDFLSGEGKERVRRLFSPLFGPRDAALGRSCPVRRAEVSALYAARVASRSLGAAVPPPDMALPDGLWGFKMSPGKYVRRRNSTTQDNSEAAKKALKVFEGRILAEADVAQKRLSARLAKYEPSVRARVEKLCQPLCMGHIADVRYRGEYSRQFGGKHLGSYD